MLHFCSGLVVDSNLTPEFEIEAVGESDGRVNKGGWRWGGKGNGRAISRIAGPRSHIPQSMDL